MNKVFKFMVFMVVLNGNSTFAQNSDYFSKQKNVEYREILNSIPVQNNQGIEIFHNERNDENKSTLEITTESKNDLIQSRRKISQMPIASNGMMNVDQNVEINQGETLKPTLVRYYSNGKLREEF